MMYYVSHLWWTQMESGIMCCLRMNLFNPTQEKDQEDKEITIVVEYFCKNRGRHHKYGVNYFHVTIFNAVHVLFDIIITHFILNR